MKDELIQILPTVSKPTRYLGNELNAVSKDPSSPGQVRFALAFPDIYDVGMSHLGSKILYHILNSRDDVWAERVYSPWIDMEMEMRLKGIPIFSLESGSPLRNFDIIGFSLQYEMSYTNVLNILDLAQIPLLAADRDGSYPLIIAGGPCAFNPEPMSDFIDFFVIGDGEEVVLEIVDCYKTQRDAGRFGSFADKRKLLSKMAEIEGIYVPALVPVEEQPDGTLAVSSSVKIRKRVITELDSAPYPVDYLVPFMRPIHDRAIIEIMRGCSRGCRFCQAGIIYRPVRERSVPSVECLAKQIINKTGYEELSLSSLSTCDHSAICEILERLTEFPGKKKHVSISLPSLRTDTFSVELARSLGNTGKTGLTFAPEVATERMQEVINKNISRSDVLSTVESAFSTGWDSLKLYFMIGLPTETEEDVLQIARLTQEALQVAVDANRRASINVSVSTFIPKAHTPFQWERQLSIGEIEQRQRLLLKRIGRNRRVNLSFHSPQVSYLEGVFARGDRRLGKVLRIAQALGCKLDGWTELFNFDAWMQAFGESGIDPDVYHRERNPDQIMPWDHIDTYVTKDFLLAERMKSRRAELTSDCRWGKCAGCGICDQKSKRVIRLASQNFQQVLPGQIGENINPDIIKIRFRFAKREALKFISHLDMLNAFTRAFRRAGIRIAYSQGFNPHPKISFGCVLPVGTASEMEFADVEVEVPIKPDDFMSWANGHLPEGLEILEAQEIPLNEQALMPQISLASYIVRVSGIVDDPSSRIWSIHNMDHIWVELDNSRRRSARRSKRGSMVDKVIDIRQRIRYIKVLRHKGEILDLEMMLGEGKQGKLRPEEVVRLLLANSTSDTDRERMLSSLEIQKIGSFIEDEGRIFSPM